MGAVVAIAASIAGDTSREATQNVYHSKAQPSHLVFEVVGTSRTRSPVDQ